MKTDYGPWATRQIGISEEAETTLSFARRSLLLINHKLLIFNSVLKIGLSSIAQFYDGLFLSPQFYGGIFFVPFVNPRTGEGKARVARNECKIKRPCSLQRMKR